MTARLLAAFGSFVLVAMGVPAAWGQDVPKTPDRGAGVAPAAQSVLRASDGENGYLGVSVDLVAPEGKSVYIVSVVDGGPAARAGLRANDVIVEVNRQAIGSLDDLDRTLRRPAGTKLVFTVRRDGALERVPVTLSERPKEPQRTEPAADETPAVDELPPPPPPAAEARPESPRESAPDTAVPRTEGGPSILQGSRPILGISVADVSDLTKRRFNVTVDTGAVISNIRAGTPAALAGLPLGGVIVSINGKPIRSANDIVDIIRAFRPGEEVEVTYFEGDRVGRKKVRLGRSAVAVTPPSPRASEGEAAAPSEPPLRLGRRRVERPLLDALERTLDAVLPPAPESRSTESATPPPPPTPGAPTVEIPDTGLTPPPPPTPGAGTTESSGVDLAGPTPTTPATGDAKELEQLRVEAQKLQKQLDVLLRRIEELEKKETPPPPPAPAAGGTGR